MPQSSKQSDFDSELTALSMEAENKLAAKNSPKDGPNFAQILRPLIVGIEAIARSQAETTRLLTAVQESTSKLAEPPPESPKEGEKKGAKAALNERLFDALHEELRTYKDDFLFDMMQKPIIKDLITLMDDLASLRKYATADLPDQKPQTDLENILLERVRTFDQNIDHAMHALEEVLARMLVERMEASTGKLNKKFQKAISVEITENPDEHDDVVKSLRPGFYWRERVIRPEEVVIKKYQVPPQESGEAAKTDQPPRTSGTDFAI
ncbi:MAG: nucleotide exchange factor GrpE [Chthoniobacteraceae bacterium]